MATLLIQPGSVSLTLQLPTLAQMSSAAFYEFCRANQDLRIERAATGEVIVMPPAFSDTGNRNFNLATQLGAWTEQDGTGVGFDSSAGFTLPNGATRSPDAAWIRRERWQALTAEQQASFAPLCPDFVVELRSASDSLTGLEAKMQEYIANGAQLGWLIDRKHRVIHVYRPNRDPELLHQPETVSGDPELPGFVLRLARVW